MSRSTWFSSRRSRVSLRSNHNRKPARFVKRPVRRGLQLEPLEDRMMLSANVYTNQTDYVPGETAHIIATDFAVGEAVEFQVLHNDGTPNTGAGHMPWTVVDGSADDLDGQVDGNIHTTWYVNPDDSAGSSFDLTATGLTSRRFAFTTFTDGNPAVVLEQWENLTNQWANGQANSNQAKYLEGDVVPYWLEARNLTVGTTYGVRINLDYYQSVTDAGGFLYLDTYNKSIVGVPQNSNDGTGGPLPALSTDNTFSFSDPLYANPGLAFTVYNADILSVSYSVSPNGLTRFADVRFKALAANENDGEATVNIYWGERLALPNEVISTANADAVSKGASGFTGGSLQTKIQGTGTAGTSWITPSNAVQLMPGVVVQGSISGYKWNDLDGQGDKDANEPGLAGWTIQLYKDDGDNVFDAGDTLIDTRVTADGTTDANGDGVINSADLGYYKFSPVLRGTYFVKEVQQAGWTQTFPANNLYGPLTISETTPNYTNKNFGNYQSGAISGQKFQDNNGDGIKNGGDAGLQGWTIQLDKDADGTVDATTTTDVNGNYSFTGLLAGTYRIREVNQPGWTQTTVNPNDVTVVSGTTSTGNNFGNFRNVSISGTKWEDHDGDGVRDAGDQGLADWHILINGVDSATTDANGNWSVTNLGPGSYTIQEVQQTGWTQTFGNAGYVYNAQSGVNAIGGNFGNFRNGSISGQKFGDTNGNGVKDGSETGLSGWTIELDKDADGTVDATTTTDVNGNYSFTGLLAGTYRIREVNQAGWTQTTVNPADVTVVSGTTSTGNDFGNRNQPCIIVIGPDKGKSSVPIVKLINQETGEELNQFYVFEPSFRGGVKVATGDMDGDGIDEIIVSTGQGRVGEVRVFTQDGIELTQFRVQPYGSSYKGGVEVEVGDVNGDGKLDIVTTNSYGPTDVRVFYSTYDSMLPLNDAISDTPDKQFAVYPSKFRGGADVVVADMGTFLNGATIDATTPDGMAEIIVGNGAGLRSTIYVYDVSGTPTVVDTILPFSNSFKGGITLSTARVNGDLIPDLIVASGIKGGSAIEIWDGLTNDLADVRLSSFTAFDNVSTKNAPVHATGIDTDGDDIIDLIAAVQGTNGTSNQIRYFRPDGTALGAFNGFNGSWNIASSCKMNPPKCDTDTFAATDHAFSQIEEEIVATITKKKKKKGKKN